MKQKMKKWLSIRTLLFTLLGMLAGYLYYRFVGCVNGTCFISSDPVISMIYMGLLGFLISGLFGKGSCNME